MYPYRTRTQWLLFGRYAHLVAAISRSRGNLQDTVLDERLKSMARWNRIRFMVIIFLSLGIIAAVGAVVVRVLPAFEPAQQLLSSIARLSGASAGVLTLAYLFLTRLLAQLEADILAILLLEH